MAYNEIMKTKLSKCCGADAKMAKTVGGPPSRLYRCTKCGLLCETASARLKPDPDRLGESAPGAIERLMKAVEPTERAKHKR